jgi:hypothetical protein
LSGRPTVDHFCFPLYSKNRDGNMTLIERCQAVLRRQISRFHSRRVDLRISLIRLAWLSLRCRPGWPCWLPRVRRAWWRVYAPWESWRGGYRRSRRRCPSLVLGSQCKEMRRVRHCRVGVGGDCPDLVHVRPAWIRHVPVGVSRWSWWLLWLWCCLWRVLLLRRGRRQFKTADGLRNCDRNRPRF